MNENKPITTDLGAVTAYAAAVEKGYTGTQDDFGQLIANFAGSAQQVADDREAVKEMKNAVDQAANSFDVHVEEKKTEASESISAAANTAKEESIAAIQEASTSGVKSVQDKTSEGVKALEMSSQTGVSNITAAVEEGKKNFVTDNTLAIPGRAADAKVTGDKIGELKEDISDLTDTIISIDKSNVSENVDNYENIESTIIKSNGKLESNSYTARFVVKKYINLTKASYTVKGFCQGNQCLYVLCDKNGDVIKYEDAISQGSSGTKTVDITINERDTILYVGGYETVIAGVKKYLYDIKLTTRLSNIYRKKVTLNGDSIAFGAGTGGTGFMDYIASKYNMTLDKKAVSGATIANLSSRYPDKHCICTSIDIMAEDANYIIFEGGYNDWFLWTQIGTLTDTMSGDLDDTKFYGALESICRQALAKWENGKIGFIITHKINDAWRTQKQEEATYPTLDGYYQAIKNVCEKYSIPYLDLSKVSRLNTELQNYKKYTYNSDGVHPTKDGYQIFYVDTIARWMENL